MDKLWAPWRMAYIESDVAAEKAKPVNVGADADPDCFLCQAVFDTEGDKKRYVVHRTDSVLTVLNKFPYNNGHLLVAPCRHVGRLNDLTTDEKVALVEEMDRLVLKLESLMFPDGFNIGLNLGRAAGAGLPGHLHWHIVPRWNGDTNYMTTIGSTKVIPQALEALWELLK